MDKRSRIPFYITFIIILFTHTSSVAQVLNLTQTDILTGAELGLVDSLDFITDVWGFYDDSTQKEYAIVGMSNRGTQLVDVTDPYNIFKVSIISNLWPIQSLNSYDVKTYGNYLYIANNYEDHILIRNISDPINPTGNTFIEVDTLGVPNTPANAHNLFISDAGKLFVAAISDGIPTEHHRVWIYDLVGNETEPVLIRSWSGPDLGLDTTSAGLYYFPHDMYVKGNTAYIAWSGTGVVVVDFNPTTYDPITVRIHEYDSKRPSGSTFRISHGIWVSDDSQYLYTTDEIGDWSQMDWAAILRIFDISDINSTPYPLLQFYDVLEESVIGQIGDNITQIVDVPSGDSNNSIHNILVKEPFAYISYYTKGVRVLDVSDPTNIIEAAYYDVPAAAVLGSLDTYSDGTWGIYPFAPSGYIYASGHDELNSLHDDFRIFKQDFIKSGAITANETWSKYAYVTNEVTVNSGVTLTIDPGTVVKFAAAARLTIKGKLIAEGTISDSIRFSALDNDAPSNTWKTIFFDHTNVNDRRKSSIKYAVITDANNGVFVKNADDSTVTISNSRISNNRIGVYSNYSDAVLIENNTIVYNDRHGVYSYSASPTVYNNEISHSSESGYGWGVTFNRSSGQIGENDIHDNTKDGILAINTGSPKIYYNATTAPKGGGNFVTDNGGDGVEVIGSGAAPNIGTGSSSKGNNCIELNTSYDVDNNTGTQVKAEYNDWGAGSGSFDGNVDASPQANIMGCTPEAMILPELFRNAFDIFPSMAYAIVSDIDTLRELNRRGMKELAEGNYDAAVSLFKVAISDHPDFDETIESIVLLHEAYKAKGNTTDMKTYINILMSDVSDKVAGRFAKRMLSHILEGEGEFDEAISISDEILLSEPTDEMRNDLLFSQGMMLGWGKGDIEESTGKFNEIIRRWPNTDRAYLAAEQIEYLDLNPVSMKKSTGQNNPNIPKKYGLSQNYPNPFNPITTINYALPAAGRVRLIVYNLRGQEVARLVDRNMIAGNHTVSWDASGFASGLYFYSLQSGNFVQTKKMMLLK